MSITSSRARAKKRRRGRRAGTGASDAARRQRLLRTRIGRERLVALDQAAGDIGGERLDHRIEAFGLGDRDAADPCILQEAVDAPVAAHLDETDHVDEQPRMFARRDADDRTDRRPWALARERARAPRAAFRAAPIPRHAIRRPLRSAPHSRRGPPGSPRSGSVGPCADPVAKRRALARPRQFSRSRPPVNHI